MKYDKLTLVLESSEGKTIKEAQWELPADDGPYNDVVFDVNRRAITEMIEKDL